MKFSFKIVSLFISLSVLLLAHTCDLIEPNFNALRYVNNWREASGLERLKRNTYLEKAALNHSLYRSSYKTGHYERYGDRGFTGNMPSDRVVFAGYSLRYASENIAEAPSSKVGMENLMTAIYHRFGFLDYNIDEIGMGQARIRGQANNIYTYVMGNSLLANECTHSSYTNENPFYYKLCKNKKQKVSVFRKNALDNKLLQKRPKFILYPYANARDVPPVFYEEHPDPLPRYSMVGNPISIEFHPGYKDKSITIQNVRLWDLETSKSLSLIPLYQRNDPNQKLITTQFAFFPLQRLQWGKTYEARLSYKISSERLSEDVIWRFQTKKQPSLITIDRKHHKFSVIRNSTYTLYFKPTSNSARNKKSLQAGFGYSYYAGTSIGHEIVDSLTIKVCLHGKTGDIFKIKSDASLGQKEVELVLK